MYEFLHENLIVHTHTFYSLQRGKRMYLQQAPADCDVDAYFEFEGYLYPPLFMLPITWRRYGYTLDDVQIIYREIDPSHVWALSLLLLSSVYEPEASMAGVKSSCQSLFTFVFISRKTVFDVYVSAFKDHILMGPNYPSALCHERPDHKPLLPRVCVNPMTFHHCAQMVPQRKPSFCHSVHFKETFSFKDIQLVPLEYDVKHQLIYMGRVVKRSIYDALEVKPKTCVVTLPVIILVDRQEYVLLEEACFFALKENSFHKRKRKTYPTKIQNKKKK